MDSNEQTQEAKVTIEDLDNLAQQYKEAREIYDEASKLSKERYKEYKSLEAKLVETLKLAGKKSYKVDDLGTFTRVVKETITVPKTIEDKQELFDWIAEKYGNEVLMDMQSIHSAKLNAFYNEERKKEDDNPLFSIPGIGAPSSMESLQFRKS